LLLLLYRAVQQIRGVLYLDISFICWFRGHLGPHLFVFGALQSKKLMDTRGQKKQQTLMYILLEAFLSMSLKYACFIDQAFFWKTAKLPAWGLLSTSATLS